MSNIYIQEPPTNGKVLLKTTVGDIDVELWTKECPKTCRNFIQLCMEGYYDGIIFHRLVKGFIVQGGDPSGTGMGGESIYGGPFKDEFHSRLKFNRRGLLGMANNGSHDDNTSQFFFTLGPTPELSGKHTLFGKIANNTIYNMIKLEESETDRNERPLNPHKILRTEILSNPFDDILPRPDAVASNKKHDRKKDDSKKPEIKATKDLKLLSFAGDDEEEEEEVISVSGKSKSSHDLITDDPHLSSVPVVDTVVSSTDSKSEKDLSSSALIDIEHRFEESIEHKKEKREKRKRQKETDDEDPERHQEGKGEQSLGESKASTLSKLEEARLEYKKLKKQVIHDRKKGSQEEENGDQTSASQGGIDEDVANFLKEKEAYREKAKQISKKGSSSREEQTMAALMKFKSKLLSEKKSESDEPKDSWLTHRLTCSKEEEGPVLAKDANMRGEADWYDIYDPRSKIAMRRAQQASSSTNATPSSSASKPS